MKEFKLLNVGVVKGNEVDDYYRVLMESEGQNFELELNFQNSSIEAFKRGVLKDFVDNLDQFESDTKEVLLNDFINGGAVQSYIDFSLSQSADCNLAIRNKFLISETATKQQLAQNLKLARIALYPDGQYDNPYYASFDYIVDGDLSGNVISLKTNEYGQCKQLAWECLIFSNFIKNYSQHKTVSSSNKC